MLSAAIQHEATESMKLFQDYLAAYFAKPGSLSQGEVADKAGIHRVNLNRIINGKQIPSLPHAEAIASATGSTLASILRKSRNRELISA